MAAPTRPFTRQSVEQDLVMVLSRLRHARQLEDVDTVEVYEAEIDRLIDRWVRVVSEVKPSPGILSGQ